MLNTHIEEHSLNAWPGLKTYLLDGLVIRLADGYTKRANSATPLYDGRLPWPEKLDAVEGIYRAAGQPPIVRLLSFRPETAEVDRLLADRGYEMLDPTGVFSLGLTPRLAAGPATSPTAVDDETFLAAYHALQGSAANPLHLRILRQAAGRPRYLVLDGQRQPLGAGLGVFNGRAIGLFDIFTHPDYRQQGNARALVAALLQWGQSQGATSAYLQVMDSNRPALSLYQQLGFEKRYRYWYRRLTNDEIRNTKYD